MESLMLQTKSGLKGLISSFGVARESFRRADNLLFTLHSVGDLAAAPGNWSIVIHSYLVVDRKKYPNAAKIGAIRLKE